jgi:hypothetical protein
VKLWAYGLVVLAGWQVVNSGGRLTGVGHTVTITSPSSSATYDAGTSETITVSGAALSDRTVVSCTYSNSLGGSGSATVTSGSWSISSVALTVGSNVVTVTCLNNAGTSAQDVITVTRSSGSLVCNTTLASPSAASVQSAINALNGTANGVVCVTGNATWSSDISLNNNVDDGITLICQAQNCTIGGSGSIGFDAVTATASNLIRVSGFTFTAASGTAKMWMYGNSDVTKLRIDHNTFSFASAAGGEIAILFGELSATGKIYGVVDHNTANTVNNIMLMKNISGGTSWTTGLQGSANSLFFEDNVCSFTNVADIGSGCIDVWRANSTVARFNDVTNSRFVNHSYCHEGPANSEIYLNTITDPDALNEIGARDYRNIHFQGSGEEIAWGNQVESDGSGNALVVQHFRADGSTATSEGNCNSQCDGTVTGSGANASNPNDGNRSGGNGYPCWHQPGRDGSAVLKPLYFFLNRTAGGTRVDMEVQSGGLIGSHLVANRDYYMAPTLTLQTSASSPFDGTSGVGMGTLANRPTTCTTGAVAADAGNGGVGYWATDQGSWNTSTSNSHGPQVNGADGVLYRCSATNTWTVHYTPAVYPHLLVTN